MSIQIKSFTQEGVIDTLKFFDKAIMTSLLTTLLFKQIPPAPEVGRSIKFDAADPDIRFSSGPIHERVLAYLKLRGEPLTAKEIAQGVGSTTSCVYYQLKRLVADRVLDIVSVEGFHPEYIIRCRR